jgi:transposase
MNTQAQGVSVRTVYKWVRRYREEGKAGLQNRSSRPRHCPHAVSQETRKRVIERRRQRQIAERLEIGHSTVARLLEREGLNRLSALTAARPENRYEHDAPGDLLHLDIKKLDRFVRPGPHWTGWRVILQLPPQQRDVALDPTASR